MGKRCGSNQQNDFQIRRKHAAPMMRRSNWPITTSAQNTTQIAHYTRRTLCARSNSRIRTFDVFTSRKKTCLVFMFSWGFWCGDVITSGKQHFLLWWFFDLAMFSLDTFAISSNSLFVNGETATLSSFYHQENNMSRFRLHQIERSEGIQHFRPNPPSGFNHFLPSCIRNNSISVYFIWQKL